MTSCDVIRAWQPGVGKLSQVIKEQNSSLKDNITFGSELLGDK